MLFDYDVMVPRVFWRAADVGMPDIHHVRPGDAASWPAPAPESHPASAVPVLHPELPQWQGAHGPEHRCQYSNQFSFIFVNFRWITYS